MKEMQMDLDRISYRNLGLLSFFSKKRNGNKIKINKLNRKR